MRRLSSLSCLSAALVLAACQDQAPPPAAPDALRLPDGTQRAVSEVLACDGGQEVQIEDLGAHQIRLTHKDKSWTLARQSSAQGGLYAGEGVQWSTALEQGQEVSRLSLVTDGAAPEVLAQCHRPAAQLAQVPAEGVAKPCITPDLGYGIEGGDAGMGHRLFTLRVENWGQGACQLDGDPQVSLIGKDDQPVTSVKTEVRTDGYFGKVRSGVPILLKPGERAYFDIGWNVIAHENRGEKTCPEVKAVRLAPPGDNGGFVQGFTMTACGGAVEVSPYRVQPDRQSVTVPPAQ